eukprot:1696228-Pleurochrysis_carterae.AAC.3
MRRLRAGRTSSKAARPTTRAASASRTVCAELTSQLVAGRRVACTAKRQTKPAVRLCSLGALLSLHQRGCHGCGVAAPWTDPEHFHPQLLQQGRSVNRFCHCSSPHLR